jgi:putative flippase GtrA
MSDNYILKKLKKLKKFNILSSMLTENSLKQLIKYIVTGLLAFVTEYAVFTLLLAPLSIFIANSVGMFVGFWISFLLNRYWSFQSRDKFFSQLLRYSSLFIINLIISNLLLKVFSDILNIYPEISKLIIMCLVVFWNFFLFKKIIYKA